MPPLLAALEAYPPAQLWTLAPKKTLADAASQFQKGAVTDIRWAGEEEVEFVHGESGQHRTLLRLKDDRISWACNRCSRQPCGHSLASMMLAGYLLRGSPAFGAPPGSLAANVLRKRLRREDKEPRDKPRAPTEAARSNHLEGEAMKRALDRLLGKDENNLLDFAGDGDAPLPGYRPKRPPHGAVRGKVLLTPGGVGYTSQIFSYHRASAHVTPPEAVAHFAFRSPDEATAEARFWEWFTKPDGERELVVVEWDDEQIPVEADERTGWTMRLDLNLDGDAITASPALLHDGEPFGKMFVPLGVGLVFLPEERRITRLREAAGWVYWERLCARLRHRALNRSADAKALPHDPLKVRARDWLEELAMWEMVRGSGKPPPLPPLLRRWQGREVEAVPLAEMELGLDLSPSPGQEDKLRAEPRFLAQGAALPHAALVLRSEELAREGDGGAGLSSAGRAAAITRALHDGWLAEDHAQREAILDALSDDPALRVPEVAKLVVRHVKNVLRFTEHPAQDIFVPVAQQGWYRVADPWRHGRMLAALARGVLGTEDGEDESFFTVNAHTAFANLPRLIEACRERGVRLTYSGQPMRSVSLQLSVSGESSKGELDWFELRPQVQCDGSLIPQDHWEQIVLNGRWMAQDGIPVVVDLKSIESLRRLKALWENQREEDDEDGAEKRKRRTLRVPRLRVLDWLMLSREGVGCDIPEGDRRVLESLLSFESLQQLPAPKGLSATMRPYQLDGYSWLAFLYRHGFGACLADDMGLGKTLQTIALLAGIAEGVVQPVSGAGDERPHLVVLPPSLLFNWTHEIQTFCPGLTVHEYTGAARSLDGIHSGVVLTTYELARRDIDKLKLKGFDVIIFDEAQAVKNLLGGRSQAMRQLQGRFKLCLTGTPMENHAGEYFSIIELAVPGLFGDYNRFMQALRNPPGAFQPLHRARPFVLRRTKDKILTELPPKVEFDLHLDLSDEQKRYYTRAVGEVREEVLKAFADKTAQQAGIVALSALTRLRQICVSPVLLDPAHVEVSPKLAYLEEKLRELQDEGHAALVFSQFTKALDALEPRLTEAGLAFQRLDGSTPQAKRKLLVEAFQNGSGPGIFLISLKAGGAGLNLTRASYVFHLDPWWNPAVENQASDRAHRMGQTKSVFIQRLLMRHTVEEKITQLKARKKALFDQVMSGAEDRATGGALITKEDFGFLLEE